MKIKGKKVKISVQKAVCLMLVLIMVLGTLAGVLANI